MHQPAFEQATHCGGVSPAVGMPEHDGVALIKAVRVHDPQVSFVAMSALPSRNLAMVEHIGVYAVLQKPLGVSQLLSVISGLYQFRNGKLG